MSNIKISELRPLGSDLLQDSESFLNELTDNEIQLLIGGKGGRGGKGGKGGKSLVVINIDTVDINTVFSANGNTIVGNSIGNGVTAVDVNQ